MKLIWRQEISTVDMHLSTGEILGWKSTLWARSGSSVCTEMYSIINLYWSTQSKDRVLEVESIYKKAYDIFEELDGSVKTIDRKVKKLVNKLFALYDWNDFRAWCLNYIRGVKNGHINLENGRKDTFTEKDKDGLTYFTEDYNDLVVFSTMLKSIMPIWGVYEATLKPTIGTTYIHLSLSNLLNVASVKKLPPFLKLVNYVNCFAHERVKSSGSSIVSGVGSTEQPKLLLALAMIKKVIIYDPLMEGPPIITNVYHLLNERCNDMSNGKPNQKRQVDDEMSEKTITDQYKMSQTIPPAASVFMEYYVRDPVVIATTLEPTVTAKLVKRYRRLVPTDLDQSEFRVSILALVVHRIINVDMLLLINHTAYCNVIAAAAAALDVWGYPEVAELLITIPEDRDIYSLTLSAASNRSFNQLKPDNARALEDLYPQKTVNKNPGQLLIDSTIKEVLKGEWAVGSPQFSDLRNSLAALILKTGEPNASTNSRTN